MKNIIYDTVIVKQTVIDTVHQAIPDSSVAIEALLKSQELYNTSFVNIQNSFSNFLIAVGIFVSTLALLNFISVKNSKRELEGIEKKLKEDFENRIDKYAAEFRKEINEYTTEFEEELESQREDFKSDRDDIFREIGNYYSTSAFDDLYKNNISEHFDKLSYCYNIYTLYEIELDRIDLIDFKSLNNYIKDYKEEYLSDAIDFLSSFSEFMKYCKETKKEKHLKEANKIWKKLCNKFGGEEKVLKAIKEIGI